jgi:hypothetical protein
MVYVRTISALAIAELVGLVVGWLLYKITSRWFPPLRTVLKYIGYLSRHADTFATPR